MGNTYTCLNYHFVFSTKKRIPWIRPDIEQRLWPYIGGLARHHKCSALQVGGTDDHAHALIRAPATLSPCCIAQFLKGDSSRWLHLEFPAMRGFSWQDGYGAFTVGKSQIPNLLDYIRRQREHHRGKTFQQEYLELLHEYGIPYDEKYLLD